MHYLDLNTEAQNEEYNDIKYKIEALKSQFISMVPLTIEKSLEKLKDIYNCVNLYVNYDFPGFDEDNNFYFKYFQKIPSPEDDRYKTIKKYACKFDDSNKTDLFCTEQFNCLTFELQARNPQNIKDIQEIVVLYEKNKKDLELFFDLIFTRDTALQKHSREMITKEEEENLLVLAHGVNEKLKTLSLVPYKYYNTNEEKFSHWAINPKIYDIVNLLFKCFSLPITETVYLLSSKDDEQLQFKTKQTFYYDIDRSTPSNPEDHYFQNEHSYVKTIHFTETYFLEHIKKLNDFSRLIQSIQLAKPFDLNFMDFEDNMEYFKLNSANIHKRVTPIHYYPNLGECSIVDFELNVSAGVTNASHLFDKLYTSLKQNNKLNSHKESSIFNIMLKDKDTGSIAEDLFFYDYFTYRQEQQKHVLKHLNELLKINKKDFQKIFKEESKSKIYREMLTDDSSFSEDAIRKKITKIRSTIETLKDS